MEERRECGLLIKQIDEELRKNANNALRPQDMTMAQLEALVELDRAPEGRRSLKELEQILHVAQSTAAGIIVRLERKGLVEGFGDVRRGPDGDRAGHLLLTSEKSAGFPVKVPPRNRGGTGCPKTPEMDSTGRKGVCGCAHRRVSERNRRLRRRLAPG